MLDAFALLGVPEDAPEAVIRRAFRRRAQVCHPDHGGHRDAMVALVQARDIAVAACRARPAEAPPPGRPRSTPYDGTITWLAGPHPRHWDEPRRTHRRRPPAPSFADVLAAETARLAT